MVQFGAVTRIGEQTKTRNDLIIKSNMARDELQQQEIEENNPMETMQKEKDQEKKVRKLEIEK